MLTLAWKDASGCSDPHVHWCLFQVSCRLMSEPKQTRKRDESVRFPYLWTCLRIYEVRPCPTTFARGSFVFIYAKRPEWAQLQLWKAVSVSTGHTYTCQAISHRLTWTSDSHLHVKTQFLCSDRRWTEPRDRNVTDNATNLHELYWPATSKVSNLL